MPVVLSLSHSQAVAPDLNEYVVTLPKLESLGVAILVWVNPFDDRLERYQLIRFDRKPIRSARNRREQQR